MNELEKKISKNEATLKKNNKGFSLVELIIVIAIMAILVGVVGTQVVPYIENSREAKDNQVLSSYCTAAASAYSSKAASITTTPIEVKLATPPTTGDALTIYNEIKNLTGFTSVSDLASGMESNAGKSITDVVITINLTTKTIKVHTDYTINPGAFQDISGKL